MSFRMRYYRMGVQLDPQLMDWRSEHLWSESAEEIRRGVLWGTQKVKLLAWVEAAMERRLTLRERTCLRLYFMEDLTFAQVAEQTGTVASSAYRAVQRGLRKLREEAARDDSWRQLYPLRGKGIDRD